MSDLADVLFSTLGCKEHTPGQTKVPVLFEGQVRLVGVLQLLVPLHELDGDVRGVEATHVTDQDIFLAKLSWMVAVHLHLGRSYSQTKRGLESAGRPRPSPFFKQCINQNDLIRMRFFNRSTNYYRGNSRRCVLFSYILK